MRISAWASLGGSAPAGVAVRPNERRTVKHPIDENTFMCSSVDKARLADLYAAYAHRVHAPSVGDPMRDGDDGAERRVAGQGRVSRYKLPEPEGLAQWSSQR